MAKYKLNIEKSILKNTIYQRKEKLRNSPTYLIQRPKLLGDTLHKGKKKSID